MPLEGAQHNILGCVYFITNFIGKGNNVGQWSLKIWRMKEGCKKLEERKWPKNNKWLMPEWINDENRVFFFQLIYKWDIICASFFHVVSTYSFRKNNSDMGISINGKKKYGRWNTSIIKGQYIKKMWARSWDNPNGYD